VLAAQAKWDVLFWCLVLYCKQFIACNKYQTNALRQTTNTTSAKTHGFGESLEPLYIFSAKKISTSELLRFLQRMAASKPTFWLSFFFYILYHLVISLGP
jgi:hypothetical protein